jgi:serine/threonine protein kinase
VKPTASLHKLALTIPLIDVKPNNVMLNWSRDEEGRLRIERVILTDLDCALKLKGEKLLNHRMGNVMWRSPEGQTGKGIGKPSEVFSFGLVVSELCFDKNAIANMLTVSLHNYGCRNAASRLRAA